MLCGGSPRARSATIFFTWTSPILCSMPRRRRAKWKAESACCLGSREIQISSPLTRTSNAGASSADKSKVHPLRRSNRAWCQFIVSVPLIVGSLLSCELNPPKAFLTEGQQIHTIADNLSAHRTSRVWQFIDRHRAVRIHFTPTYSSWLNQVEIWFSKIQRDVIARGIFRSVKDL